MLNHILIIDDDDRIRILLSRYLQDSGYIVSTAASTKAADELVKMFIFDIVILDNMMPKESGIEFLKRGGAENTPVIMLSALGHVDDKIGGLSCGAEDYLTKPFEPRELILRIEKILERTKPKLEKISFGDFTFDIGSQNLYKNDLLIKLTQAEKKLLKILASNNGKIINRNEILQNFEGTEPRSIDAHMVRLRAKIEDDPKNPKHLQTIRGEGYVLYF